MKAQAMTREELAAYQRESRGLERDYIGELVSSRNRAWFVAFASMGISAMAVGAVMLLTPLKRTETAVVRVDTTTGAADVVQSIGTKRVTEGEVVDKYFLNQYVLNRESYDYTTIQLGYDTTALLSAPDVQAQYYRLFEGSQAPDKVYGQATRIRTTIKSITPGGTDKARSAVVRFSTQKVASDGSSAAAPEHWIATLGYRYVQAPISEKDRRINPLGFQVTSYRVDPETISAQ